jgi:hypothetical protein
MSLLPPLPVDAVIFAGNLQLPFRFSAAKTGEKGGVAYLH